MPGLMLTWEHDKADSIAEPDEVATLFAQEFRYFPKIRGQEDYNMCHPRETLFPLE